MNKLNMSKAPSLLVGERSSSLEASGRMSIPSLWRPSFRSKSIFAFTSRMGEIPFNLLFPEVNFRWLLESVDPDKVAPLLRSAEQIGVDGQARFVLPRSSHVIPSSVSILGAGAYLQVFPNSVAELIRSGDQEIIDGIATPLLGKPV